MKNQKFLVVYDYYFLKDGTEQYGIVGIFLSYLNTKNIKYKVNKTAFSESFLNIIKKFLSLYKEIKNNKFETIFCYNLINTINSWLIKVILLRNYKVVFISADFSKKRFNSFILSQIYIFLDYFASLIANEVWSCSKRVYDYRSSFLKPNKSFYIPNIPNYKKLNLRKYEKFTIVMISFLNFNYMFEEVYKLFEYIKKNDLNLLIIGEGELKKEIEEKIRAYKAEDQVKILGYLNHEEIKKILEKSHLGLALYGGKVDYNFWGDSIKIREYTYYNLPTITTKNVYNEKEVRSENLGVCIEDFSGLLESIKKLYEDKEFYFNIVESTKRYNEKYLINNIFEERIR